MSVFSPLGVACIKNLSLQTLKSAGISRCACIITITFISPPGSTIPVFGLTQYFFGDVVFTLKASFVPVGFFNTISDAHCFLSSKANGNSPDGVTTKLSPLIGGYWIRSNNVLFVDDDDDGPSSRLARVRRRGWNSVRECEVSRPGSARTPRCPH